MFKRGRWTALFAAALVVSVGACGDDDDDGGMGIGDPPEAPAPPAVWENGGALVVNWAAVTGADDYDVQRQTGSGSFETIAEDVSGTSYTDDSAGVNVGYNYRVVANNQYGSSDAGGSTAAEVGVLSSNSSITGDATLSSDIEYVIEGVVVVDDGGSITIPAGTVLKGSLDVTPSALMIRQGGQIFSQGTAEDPVVFTSGAAEGERTRGDWGGVVINGYSLCNFPSDQCVGEGESGNYGGDDEDDDSGEITYTRIEFAGYEVSFGNELNALTLNGVGRGTTLEYIQTHYGSDDGFEWFGGTVDLKYAIATGISDDSFDYSTGWQGRGQFWIAQQDPDDADNGFEVDGNEDDYDAEPFTDPTIYNITLVGKGLDGAGGTDGESVDGLRLRRGTSGDIFNAIVIGFGTSGVDIDNVETQGRYTVQNSIISRNANDLAEDDDDLQDDLEQAAWNNQIGAAADPLLVDPFNRDAPNFRPGAGSPALAGFATPPSDGFFETVDFIGAVDPDSATQWFEGWTTLVRN
jgi:hypothetical protein